MTDALTRPLEWAPPKRAISKVPYLPGLDGMRAIAVVAVMIYHANTEWLPGGFLGVEVFFVISGYLITLLLIGEHERTGAVSLGHFWLRRAKRLLPALYVLLILVTVYTTFFREDALGQLRGDVIAALAYVSNWYQIWAGQGYTASGDFAPLRHLWSLAVEEQFYLAWPLIMVGLMRLGRRRLPELARWVFLVAVAISVATALLYHEGPIESCEVTPEAYWQIAGRCISKVDALYLNTFSRASGILLGAALAMIWRPLALRRGPIREKGPLLDLIAICGLLGLAAMTWTIHLVTPEGADALLFRGGMFMTGIATLAMIAAVTHPSALTGKVLGTAVLLWIGTRSYGLYLYHWPVYQGIRRVAGTPLTFWQFVLAIAITLPITEVSYRLIETPIRTGRVTAWWRRLKAQRDPVPRRVIAGGAASIAAVSMFAFANLATAELKPNEIAQSLDEGAQAVTDLGQTAMPTSTGPSTATDVSPPADTTATAGTDASASPATPLPRSSPVTSSATSPTGVDPAASTTVAAVPPASTAAAPPPRKVAIGDSVMLGAAEELAAAGFEVDAQESRQMSSYVPVLEGLRDSGQLSTIGVAVVHLGTNGSFSADTAARFFGALSSVPRVIVLTIRADRSWTVPNNDRLYDLPTQYPNVQVLDWGAQSANCPGDCFYDDGIHLKPAGQNYYTALAQQAATS
jgi:peptidoglycan/LPS O-acetylase OafA/YrhL